MGRKKDQANHSKRDLILSTATRLFLEKGYSATSTTDICSAASINRPTLYWYFNSKRHLFFSCHVKSIEEQLKPYLKEAESMEDPDERLRHMIREFTKLICLNPELKVLIHETMSINDQYFRKVRTVWKKHYLLLKTTLSELQSKGRVRPSLKPSWTALFLLGMMTWTTFWFDHDRPEEVDRIADEALEVALSGLYLPETH